MTSFPTYVFSSPQVPGVVAANSYLALLNPIGSPKLVVLGGVFISQQTVGAVSMVAPMRGWLATDVSGGTPVPKANVGRAVTAHGDPFAELVSDNPSATLGAAWFNSPALQATGAATAPFIHQIPTFLPGGFPITLAPGEATVLRTEVGSVNQRWNVSIAWTEVLIR